MAPLSLPFSPSLAQWEIAKFLCVCVVFLSLESIFTKGISSFTRLWWRRPLYTSGWVEGVRAGALFPRVSQAAHAQFAVCFAASALTSGFAASARTTGNSVVSYEDVFQFKGFSHSFLPSSFSLVAGLWQIEDWNNISKAIPAIKCTFVIWQPEFSPIAPFGGGTLKLFLEIALFFQIVMKFLKNKSSTFPK